MRSRITTCGIRFPSKCLHRSRSFLRHGKWKFLPRRNDIILCRNVMIYFDEAEQKRLIEKFWHCLNPSGYLFVGHAESLFGLTQKFRMVHENNGTAYQRNEVHT